MKKSAILLVVLCAFTGCAPHVEKQQATTRPVAPDPVAQLKKAIERVSSGKTESFEREWTKIVYDVTKTESLVSPVSAYIRAEVFRSGSRTTRTDYMIHLAFQEGTWRLKQIIRNFGTPSVSDGGASLFFYGEEDMPPDGTEWKMVQYELGL